MDDLLGILETEEKEYRRLIGLSEQKRQIIIDANIPELEKITEQEQYVTDMLHNLELKRNGVLSDMAVVLGQKSEELTIDKMILILEKQPEEQKKLIELRANLRATLDEMILWNRQNQMLLKNALEMVEFDLNLFKSLRQAPETANYNRAAYNTGDLLGGGGFDAKQ
jgi:hypothetical protein